MRHGELINGKPEWHKGNFLKMPDGSSRLNPKTADYLEAGLKPEKKVTPAQYERQGQIKEEADCLTYHIIPWPPEEIKMTLKSACESHIKETLGWTIEKQCSALAGIYGQTIINAWKQALSASIAECNRCEDLIDTNKVFTAVWPVSPVAYSYNEAKTL